MEEQKQKKKRKARKTTQGLFWMVNSLPKHKVPTSVKSPFTVVVSENVFCQGMVVLLNLVCIVLSGMIHVYKSEVRVAVFETS